MAGEKSAYRFPHSPSAIVQMLRIQLEADAQRSLAEAISLMDDRDRWVEDNFASFDSRLGGGGSGGTGGLLPTGSIIPFAGATPPDKFLLCDGSLIDRGIYSNLFDVIGTVWGAGDGSTTFKLPDLRGRVPVFAGIGAGLSSRVLAATGGAETHTLTEAQMPSHWHTYNAGANPSGPYGSEGGTWPYHTQNSGNYTTGAKGGGAAHPIMQPFAVLNAIIRT